MNPPRIGPVGHALPALPGRQRGAALLAAMLTVTLVATLAAAALWQQWRAVEVETAERARLQASWVLVGALDWSRLILREDGRSGGADHLAEPWAIPLEEARLSTFLAADKKGAVEIPDDLPNAFLSGRIVDAQSKLNVLNLVEAGKEVPEPVAAFAKLFGLLGLPQEELSTLIGNLQRILPGPPATAAAPGTTATPSTSTSAVTVMGTATATFTPPAASTSAAAAASSSAVTPTSAPPPAMALDANAPLMPLQIAQLTWLGLSSATIAALEPYVTVLPVRTALNVNTASAEALFASVPALDLAGARRLVMHRSRSYFRNLSEGGDVMGTARFVDGQHGVASSFFETHGRLRIDNAWVEEHSLLRRNGMEMAILWRERGAGTMPAAARND